MKTFSRFVDARTGIVRSVARATLHPHLPQELVCYVARLADTSRFCAWPSDPTTTGCAWWDADAAQRAALGEAAERYAGNLVPANVLHASYRDLVAAGYTACAPAEIGLFSTEQYAQPSFPFVRFTDDLVVNWVEGQDMRTGATTLVPASLVYVTYPRAEGPSSTAPLTNPVIVAGVAAGAVRQDSECAALEELIERDTVSVAWLTGAQLSIVEPPEQVVPLFAGPLGVLETTIILFPTPYRLPVLGALVYDRATSRVTLGTACRPHAFDAMLKAYAEAAQLQMLAHDLHDPHSSLMQAVEQTPHSPLKPWRADCAYTRSYRTDWRDVSDLLCHLQLYLDPCMRSGLVAQLSNAPMVTLHQIEAGAVREREPYLERLHAVDTSLYSVDVTTPDIAALDLSVVRVVAPGLCTNTPAAFPLWGSRRLPPTHARHYPTLPLPYA